MKIIKKYAVRCDTMLSILHYESRALKETLAVTKRCTVQ